MPIRLPQNLPAFDTLRAEGVSIMSERTADRQDIRPLRIALLNLMPKKIETETQFSRLIGATPLQIDLHLLRMTDHVSRNTDASHMEQFYRPWSDVSNERYDGLIITGAPVEHLEFSDVNYWDELEQIFNWTQTHIHSTMAVCWAAMAAIYHFHDIAKLKLDAKRFGAFRHENRAQTHPILRGLSDNFVVPVSRWTEIARDDVLARDYLDILIDSDDAGVCLVDDPSRRMYYNFNHFEYDSHTLKGEYDRDIAEGRTINVPVNYYPDDDPTKPPINRWKSAAHLLYTNWIAEIYQNTPYDINKIGVERHEPEL